MFSQPEYALPEITTAILAVGYPLFCMLTFRKTLRKIKSGHLNRLQYYQRSIIIFLCMAALVAINYVSGTLQPVIWFAEINHAAIVFTVLIVLFIVVQLRQKIKPEDVMDIRSGMEPIWIYLPKSAMEYRFYLMLSITAGICEELVFRYYLYHVFHLYLPAPVSILILNFLFALSRIHTGFQNMASTFVLGMIFSVIYYFSGYLVLPIILHAAIEIQTGLIGFKVYNHIKTQSS